MVEVLKEEYKAVDIESYDKGWKDAVTSILEVMTYWETHDVRSTDGVPDLMLREEFREVNRGKDKIGYIKHWINSHVEKENFKVRIKERLNIS